MKKKMRQKNGVGDSAVVQQMSPNYRDVGLNHFSNNTYWLHGSFLLEYS